MIPLPIYIFLIIELLFVTYGDLKSRKIPNYWSILNLILFGTLAFLFPTIYIIKGEIFLYSFMFFFIGFALYLFKIMGGGDAKFLATFILIIPADLQALFFQSLLYGTIICAGLLIIINSIKNFSKIMEQLRYKNLYGVKSFFGTKFAYAPVILIAWILVGIEIRKSLF